MVDNIQKYFEGLLKVRSRPSSERILLERYDIPGL